MSCKCHGKQGVEVKGTVLPDDQCLTCAAKHISMARAAWGEFTYELDNRYWCAGHVRLAVEHLKIDHRDLALKLRDLAVAMESVEDVTNTDIRDRLADAHRAVLALLQEEKPMYAIRLSSLKEQDEPIPVIIPLGNGSKSENDELKLLLRSLERHAQDLGRVIVVTDNPPDWLVKADILRIPDYYEHNKDANIIDKTIAAIAAYHLQEFAWFTDDTLLVRDMRLADIPVLKDNRTRNDFKSETSVWHARMRHTYDWAASIGKKLDCCYETHAPQFFRHAQMLLEHVRQMDYHTAPGLAVMTLFRVVMGELDAEQFDCWKTTLESKESVDIPLDRPLLGYNDEAFHGGLRERLFGLYPQKSAYEK